MNKISIFHYILSVTINITIKETELSHGEVAHSPILYYRHMRVNVFHAMPDKLDDVEIRSLWGPYHHFQDFLLFFILKIILMTLAVWGPCPTAEQIWDQSYASLMVLHDG